MKIVTKGWNGTNHHDSIEKYARNALDGQDYDSGQLESIGNTAENNSKAIGRILDLFAGRGLVSAEEVFFILEGETCESGTYFRKEKDDQ